MPRRVTITLDDRYLAALDHVAERHHAGNRSATVRALIEANPVTKSALQLPGKATKGGA